VQTSAADHLLEFSGTARAGLARVQAAVRGYVQAMAAEFEIGKRNQCEQFAKTENVLLGQ